ncbi:MAG: TrkH family potassium uptake protein [Clostridia bacterium]|nr:TrkH family potassium uptake protein [Clostridia bacterium]
MNVKAVLNTLGKISLVEGILIVLPLMVSLLYGEMSGAAAFAATIAISAATGGFLLLLTKNHNHLIYAKEGFAIVAGVWILISLIGALPFRFSGVIPHYVDAVFETVSGFTTTGASIIEDVEAISKGMLFWRSFTHFIGGMGFLVFVMAIIPNVTDRSIHILKAEVPGPNVGKIVPKIKDTAKILYLIYIAITAVEIVLLVLGGMPLFDSIVHSFATAGTGGFGIKSDSISSYSPYCQWVIGIFMMLFGVNFNIYYLILIKRFKDIMKSSELWVYISIAFCSTAVITFNNIEIYKRISLSVRHSFFQVSSIMTTTGFATADFDRWGGLPKTILLTLMFIGACAGSTGGGLKVSRVIMLFKIISREIRRLLHPRAVTSIHFEGKKVDENTIGGVSHYFAIYMICFVAAFLLISFEPFGIETNISATAACFNNIGPGLDLVGPTMNYSAYSYFSKIVLSAAMLLGRLEIFPIIIAFSPSVWKNA